jgi:hypothetical protein
MLGAAAARIAMLALIDATSFPSITEAYVSPASPMLYVWIFAGLAAAAFPRLVRQAAPQEPPLAGPLLDNNPSV